MNNFNKCYGSHLFVCSHMFNDHYIVNIFLRLCTMFGVASNINDSREESNVKVLKLLLKRLKFDSVLVQCKFF